MAYIQVESVLCRYDERREHLSHIVQEAVLRMFGTSSREIKLALKTRMGLPEMLAKIDRAVQYADSLDHAPLKDLVTYQIALSDMVNRTQDRRRLLSAMYERDFDTVKQLVLSGIDPSPALPIASICNNVEWLRWLLDHGADVHYDEDAALYFAGLRKHNDALRILLEHGADRKSRMNCLEFHATKDPVMIDIVQTTTANAARSRSKHNPVSSISRTAEPRPR